MKLISTGKKVAKKSDRIQMNSQGTCCRGSM